MYWSYEVPVALPETATLMLCMMPRMRPCPAVAMRGSAACNTLR